ncbi:aminopeptidase N [Streptomyces lonarensis]|uniref:Aminopeptidase N n=1 Tax=Streptomyces lonarensis TaxID=700599 RepID=A0A7X6D1U3_9ACTN|nr:aminopeptidase N [Streptomyces lonarensis]NJQ06458.1 aminopeptidase N [Streptomyces lonarensis]
MAILTRDEARERARLLDVHRYTVDLDLTRGAEVFRSATTVRFAAREDGETFVEVVAPAVHRVTLDGREIDPAAVTDGRLPLTVGAGEHELHVEADMAYSHTGEGMHRFTDPADSLTYLYTQCCLSEAPKVFAAFDQPDLKAVFEVHVTAPPEWTVLANGVCAPVEGEPGRWSAAPTPPISTYLLAVAAGPWHSIRTEHAGLPFGLHARQSLAEHLDKDADELWDITRRTFDRYHEIFDEPYPFDSYDQAFVPEFNAGAMENPGLVTFRDEFVHRSAVTDTERQLRGIVIAHEMAHMWFGDLVTLRWWDDIWLNEAFAEYMGYQVLAEATDFQPWTEFAAQRKAWGLDADQRPSTHPVAPLPEAVPDTASAWLNFDGISYAKGASALRQLVVWLGEKDFLAGINEHFARHRFGNADLAEFIDSLSHASGRDVHSWADRWLRTAGPDTLTPAVTVSPDGWRLELTHTGGRPHRLRVGTYGTSAADPGRPVPLEPHDLDLPPTDGVAVVEGAGERPALLVVNDGELTYARVGLDEGSWETASRTVSALPDPLTRTVVWGAAREMVREAALPPAALVAMAREQLPEEEDLAVLEAVVTFARSTVADCYLAGSARELALASLRDLAREILDRPGTPARRLLAARCLIGAAAHPGDLRRWLGEGTLPGGPVLDPKLRWQLLHRLAVLGDLTPEEIDAEAAADPGATAEEGAARCRAALPTAEHKAAAWEAMFGDGDRLSAYLFAATAQGFWHPEHDDLLAPYVERYFAEVPALAERRGHALTTAACRHAFPATSVSEETLRLGAAVRDDASVGAALRRGLTDRLDDLSRALRVRSAATP